MIDLIVAMFGGLFDQTLSSCRGTSWRSTFQPSPTRSSTNCVRLVARAFVRVLSTSRMTFPRFSTSGSLMPAYIQRQFDAGLDVGRALRVIQTVYEHIVVVPLPNAYVRVHIAPSHIVGKQRRPIRVGGQFALEHYGRIGIGAPL